MTAPAWRRALVALSLAAALGLVLYLDREAGGRPDSSAAGFRMEEVAAEVGVDFVHHGPELDPKLSNIGPYLASLGASVSVADVDGDGWVDLYFTNSRFGHPNALYLNEGDGTFREAAADAGIADLNRPGEGVSMGSLWADYDNDGREDLLVYRWGYPALYRNLGDLRFEEVTEEAGLRVWMNANGAAWIDYDRDGHLDLFLAGYYRSDVNLWELESTRIMPNSFEYASNGGRNRLFRNLGDGRFRDVTEETGVGGSRWTMAVGAADFDQDGWPDLYLANDYGPEELYLNRGGERFELAGAGLGESGSGMSVAMGDLHNRDRIDVYVTNISERGYLFQGNNLRLNFLEELDRFEEAAKGPVADAGWAWSAQFGDLNLDGLTDLFVTNGFISASRERDYWYGMAKITGANRSIIEDTRNWPPIGDASLSGYQRSRVLVNLGREGLRDLAPAVGVSDRYDGRAVAFADLFNEGELDAVVANQNGPALVYRNRVEPGRHWIAFRLVGRESNRSAVGAEVTVELAGGSQRQVVSAGSGFASQNDRRLLFGLDRAASVPRVVVRWPSGTEQVLEDVPADRLHVVREPAR